MRAQTALCVLDENAMDIAEKETGLVFARVPEHTGVCARDATGKAAFLRFADSVR